IVVGGTLATVRQGEPRDLPHNASELFVKRTGVVRDAVALADLTHLDRDLGVAVSRDVGKEMVLDLETEVAGEDVEELPAGQVGRTEQLAVVPLSAGLFRRLLLRELLRPVGEVPAEDDRERPQVPG